MRRKGGRDISEKKRWIWKDERQSEMARLLAGSVKGFQLGNVDKGKEGENNWMNHK